MDNSYLKHSIINSFPRIYKSTIIRLKPIFIFVENWIQYDVIHNFSVWLRADSNPTDINGFLSNTGKNILY